MSRSNGAMLLNLGPNKDYAMINILLVDDEKIEAKLVDLALRKTIGKGFQLDFALNVNQALEHLKSKSYDLILLDNLLPRGISAKNTLPIIAPHKGNADIAIISSLIDQDRLRSEVGVYIDDIVEKFYLKEYFLEKFKPISPDAVRQNG